MGAPARDARLEADSAGGQTNRQLFAKTEIMSYTFSCSLDPLAGVGWETE